MTNRETLLRKLKALSERGEGGEAINAAEKLKQLMQQYGMDEYDLEDESREDHEFKHEGGQFDDRLLCQVIYMVMGDVPIYDIKRGGRLVPRTKIVACTKAEQIEIQTAYDFYQHHLKAGLDNYYNAFVQKERIFPDASKKHSEYAKPTSFDEDVTRLYNSIDKHDRNPQLEAGRGRR